MKQRLELSLADRQKLSQVKAVISDVDKTLVLNNKSGFYSQYGQMIERAIAEHYQVSTEAARDIAAFYRQHYHAAEQALFMGDVHKYFPNVTPKSADVAKLFELLITLDPTGFFDKQEESRSLIDQLRKRDVKVVAVTNSPDELSRKILQEAGFNPDEDFDMFLAYTRNDGPPKIVQRGQIFSHIATTLGVKLNEVVAVGDSFVHDVQPALELGMIGCLLTESAQSDFSGIAAIRATQILQEILLAKNESEE